ncbi:MULTISPECIES: DUF6461 domain-containing protein [unclassified Gordonia (in: high G+C Gram-positive bacteria)]|uniref:DUF6461 domain-containing protein n=1 Tax=unclassified Gordonia (in: high G+C Gram-positive bacteria) TaxID=2657482 RepID=UPI0019660906|nr:MULTISPECIES: DUF6461 domain-containing protein [unclassified Gordonia (in: high G+C Gram-positive bacteria)]MBN0975105.1 hypothetical protein [Gordonia sp. BP-119]MBN0985278.1 hypothetical protein [Gordonia sp. BP-94]
MATYRDAWIREEAWIQNAYCITLISAIEPDQVLTSLHARQDRPVAVGADDAFYEGGDLAKDQQLSVTEHQVVAVANAGNGWSLMIQDNGYIGTTDSAMASLTANHEVVSQSQNINGDNYFVWWRDGVRQVLFSPSNPVWELVGEGAAYQGSAAGVARIVELINEVGGIELNGPPPEGRTNSHHVEGAFALAEQLTGVAVTPRLLVKASFTVAVVPVNAATAGHGPATDEPSRAQVDEVPTWEQVMKLHTSSHKLPIHGTLIESDHDIDATRTVEFWRKHKRAWRIADEAGVCRIVGRRGENWFRVDGELTDEPGSRHTEGLHPMLLLQILDNWTFGRHTAPTVPWEKGTPVTVASRPAWEFAVKDEHRNPSRIAFDAATGIAVRWQRDSTTYELTTLDADIKLPDDLFEGP